MKTILKYLLFLLPFTSIAQFTPWKVCQYQGTASGQDTYSVTIGGENMNQLTPFIMEEIAVTYTATNTGASTLKVNQYTYLIQ